MTAMYIFKKLKPIGPNDMMNIKSLVLCEREQHLTA